MEISFVRPVSLGRLETHLREQDVGQLLRRVDVELTTGVPVDARAEIVQLALHLAAEHRERLGVHLDAGALDVGQHGNEGLLPARGRRRSGLRARRLPARPGAMRERQVRALARVGRKRCGRHGAHRQRLRALCRAHPLRSRPDSPSVRARGPRSNGSTAWRRAGSSATIVSTSGPLRVDALTRGRDRHKLQIVTDLLDRRDRPGSARSCSNSSAGLTFGGSTRPSWPIGT